ncbi:MAG: hypothetical protein NT045_06155, partial [Candidatus Aureabacteria bacterium]|nr:hypothetical protein [Candidatus Auribacterota bacterium]
MRNGCTVVAFIAGMLQALAVAGQTDSNYVDLQAQVINLEGAVQLSYTCHAQEFGYQNVPVDVYIGAKLNSPIADAAASVDQLLAGGGVRIFYPGMRGTYQYTTALAAPTFSRVAFSDVVMSGSVVIDSVAASIYDGSYTMFIVFMYSGNGGFVRGDGMPVELSN